jgi:hypothetical protein
MGQVSPPDPQKISRLPRPANIPRAFQTLHPPRSLLFGSRVSLRVPVRLPRPSNPLLPNFCTDTWKKFSIDREEMGTQRGNLEPSLSRLGRCQYLFSYETHGLFLHWTTVLHFNQLGPQTLVCDVYIASRRNFIRNIVQSVLFFLSLGSSDLCYLMTTNKERREYTNKLFACIGIAAVLATRVIACS